MHELAPLIQDLTIMLGVASLVTLLFQRIKQPVVLGYLVAGMLIGPYILPYNFIIKDQEISVLSELGVIFLMFSLGLDFSFHKLTRVGFSASITGVIEVLLMITIGYITGWALHWPFFDRVFLGATLAISSSTIIIKTLEELHLKSKRFAEFIFGILVIEDLLAILLLVALSTLVVTKNIFSTEMVVSFFKLIFIVGGWFLIGYFIVPTFLRGISRFANQETLTIVSIALCLVLVATSAYFHYSTALGAFIMGSILAETPLVHRIEQMIRPIRDIFAAVFFISVGMLIDPKVIFQHFPTVLIITTVYLVGKTITTTLGALLTGQSLNTSVRIGFGVAQIGEFSFIIASLGLMLHVTGDQLYPIIVAISAITTFTTPLMFKFSGYLTKKIDTQLPEQLKLFLDSYSAWVYRALASSTTHNTYRNAIIRLILNGIVVAIVFSLVQYLVLPEISKMLDKRWMSRSITWTIAMILSSPFIWGMLFSLRPETIGRGRKDMFFRSTPIIVCWLAAAIEITVLSITYFHTLLITTFLILITFGFSFISFQHLEKSYQWFEKRLVGNIKSPRGKHARYERLAPWETHFVEIVVGDNSPLINKSLTESELRQRFGINIVAIYRGTQEILAPRGNQHIQAGDKLIVLGVDEQLDAFKEIATRTLQIPQEEIETLQNFTLRAIVLDESNPMINKTIRKSGIREQTNGVVVGLERNGKRTLNPDPGTILHTGDLLLVVKARQS